MFKRLAMLLRKFPMKSIFISIIVIVLLVTGVRKVFMATGNDTLVKTNTDVYQDNVMLEEEFGGESIIVLYESENLLTPNNFAHMKGIENTLETSDSIYSMISPVTLVEEIANKQASTFQEGISEIIDGLNEMGIKLIEIGTDIQDNAKQNQPIEFPVQREPQIPVQDETELPDLGEFEIPEIERAEFPEFEEIKLPDMGAQLSGLNKGFANLIGAQKNLADGTKNLVEGYDQFGTETKKIAEGLSLLADQMEDSPQRTQLNEVSQGLVQLSEKMTQISEDSAMLPEITGQTIDGLENMQEKLTEQLNEQAKQQELIQTKQKQQQEKLKDKIQTEQAEKKVNMKQQIQEQQTVKQEEMKAQIEEQQAQKENQLQEFQHKMKQKQDEQADKLGTLSEGLTKMGKNLQSISENMGAIYDYSDIMTPGLPKKQTTLDHIIYDDGELRPMFDEVIVDDNHMIMMIKFKGSTDDTEKSKVVERINNYLDTEQLDSVETLVSGKPVLDNAIKSSMKQSIQKMMGLALLLMVIVLFFVFKVRWRLLPLLIVLIAVIGTVGLMGWLQIPITMVSMAVFPILIGLGIDYAIQFQNRYTEEMTKESSNESE